MAISERNEIRARKTCPILPSAPAENRSTAACPSPGVSPRRGARCSIASSLSRAHGPLRADAASGGSCWDERFAALLSVAARVLPLPAQAGTEPGAPMVAVPSRFLAPSRLGCELVWDPLAINSTNAARDVGKGEAGRLCHHRMRMRDCLSRYTRGGRPLPYPHYPPPYLTTSLSHYLTTSLSHYLTTPLHRAGGRLLRLAGRG